MRKKYLEQSHFNAIEGNFAGALMQFFLVPLQINLRVHSLIYQCTGKCFLNRSILVAIISNL